MAKVICIYRTSTEAQEVESQKKEVIGMALEDGHSESDMILIGCAGASAIKLDKKYLEQIQMVYDTIDREDISCVYAWAIDRIGRNEVVLMQFKNKMIENKIQLKIRSISTPLFDRNGNVDAGFELVYSFFSTQAKQEMEMKQARFERARKRNFADGRYNGGGVALGYCVDDRGFLAIEPKEAELVREIYRLFNTGKYSVVSLSRELNQRGLRTRGGTEFRDSIIYHILKFKAYTGGFTDKKGRVHTFPVIVSEDEQKKAASILSANNSNQIKGVKHYRFATKLIVCHECGHHFQVINDSYKCCGYIMSLRKDNRAGICRNAIRITHRNLDGILWELTKMLLLEEIETDRTELERESKEKMAVLRQKISTCREKISKYDDKILEIYDKGDLELLPEEIIQRRVANVKKAKSEDEKELVRLEEELARLERNMNYDSQIHRYFTGYNSISEIELKGDEKVMFDLVHRYISKVTIDRCAFRGKDSYKRLEVTTGKGIYTFFYNGRGRAKKGEGCFIRYPNETTESQFKFNPIERTDYGVTTQANERFKKFIARIEELVSKGVPRMMLHDVIDSDPELGKLHEQVIADNNQRVVHYLNEVSLKTDWRA